RPQRGGQRHDRDERRSRAGRVGEEVSGRIRATCMNRVAGTTRRDDKIMFAPVAPRRCQGRRADATATESALPSELPSGYAGGHPLSERIYVASVSEFDGPGGRGHV